VTSTPRLIFYSRHAFHEPLFRTFHLLCREYALDGLIVTHERVAVPTVYAPTGVLTKPARGSDTARAPVIVPAGAGPAEQRRLVLAAVRQFDPDYLWIYEEPIDRVANHLLRRFYWSRRPRIIAAVIQNLWPVARSWRGRLGVLDRRLRWRRWDGILSVARMNAPAIRTYGMPARVPIRVAGLPTLEPPPGPATAWPAAWPRREAGDVLVGFAGRITAAKGWRVLLAALAGLPSTYKCLVAGGGDEDAPLRLWCSCPQFRERVFPLGVVPKPALWSFYRALDLLVVPSLTTPDWCEQFGWVIAEAMACGVPVIGSSSGAIPEVVGDCGVIVPENDAPALAAAIHSLASDPEQRRRLGDMGRRRFQREFSCTAYAESVARTLGLPALAARDQSGGAPHEARDGSVSGRLRNTTRS